jgi:DNA-binding XRE family transcriptional regulator
MIDKNDSSLGKVIKNYRKKNGLTQEQFAEKLELSTKYIQFLENGVRKPSLKTIYKIAKVLRLKIHDLFHF